MHWKMFSFLVNLGFLLLADAKGIRLLHDKSKKNLNENINKNREKKHNHNYNNNIYGAFGRDLQSMSMSMPPVMPPSMGPRPTYPPTSGRASKNSLCRNATLIQQSLFHDAGDTTLSNVLGAGNRQTCFLITESSSILWYKFEGSNNCVTVKTTGSEIDTVLAVYEGNCGNLKCLKQNDDSPSSSDLTSEVSWEAKEGTTYHLALSGYYGATGRVQLEFTAESCPMNKKCYEANSLGELPSVVKDNYLFGSPQGQSDGDICPGLPFSNRSLWYSMTGKEDACYIAGLNGTSYGTTLSIHSGSCTDLQCMESRNDGSRLAWVGSSGTYLIAVSGDDTLASGSFTLLVDEIECPFKSDCNNVIPVTNFPYSYEFYQPFDSFFSAIGPDSPALACPEIQEGVQGTWFEMESDTGCYTVSIDGYVSDAVLAVYNGGDCDALTCHKSLHHIVHSDDNYTVREVRRTISWEDKNATSFKVFVAATTVIDLFYELKFENECRDIPANDDCSDATTIDDLPVLLFGDLTYGTPDQGYLDTYYCYLADEFQVTSWYEFSPENDTCVEASITSSHYTYVSIFSGTGCYDFEPTCISQAYGNNSTVLFNAQAGKQYWIRVAQTDYESGKGSFTLALSANDCAANDLCEGAFKVDQLPFVAEGSTRYATGESNNSSCYYLTSESPTVWFEVEASDSGCLTAIIADDFTAAMAVYSGGCSSLKCMNQVGYGDDEVTWRTSEGETYKIAIGSPELGNRGDFKLIIVESDDCGNIPQNSQCADSQSILSLPFTDAVSTKFVNRLGDDVPASECTNYVNYDTRGVWYSVASTSEDECFIASSEGSEFDTIIALYEGDSCTTRSCLQENDDFGGSLSSQITWRGQPDKNFHVFFAGLGVSVGGLEVFVDRITCGSGEREGCSNPRSIDQLPFVDANDLGHMDTSDNPNITCSSHYWWGPNRWYKFEGKTDTCVTASIAPDSYSDMGLAIYEGDNCKNSTCVAETQVYSTKKLVTWAVSLGSTYIVAVHGSGSSRSFVLTIVESDCDDVIDNKICAGAISVDDDPIIVASNAYFSMGDSGVAADAARLLCGANDALYNPLWYSVEGDGLCVSVDVVAEFVPSVMVFTGSCDTLECLLFTDGNERISWKSEVGEKYSILVAGLWYGSGKFSVHIQHGDCGENDVVDNKICADAISVDDNPIIIASNAYDSMGDSGIAADAARLLCGANETLYNPSWYSFEGDGSCVSVDVVAEFAPSVTVFEGSCETLECHLFYDGNGRMSWKSEAGEQYFILVGGLWYGSGKFSVHIEHGACAENDSCGNGIAIGDIQSKPFIDYGNNDFASSEGLSAAFDCSRLLPDSTTLWYSYRGKGHCVTASLAAAFDSRLLAYEGACDTLQCWRQSSDGDAVLNWFARNETDYMFAIVSAVGGSGDFTFTVTSSDNCEQNTNDACIRSLDVGEFPYEEQTDSFDLLDISDHPSALVCSVVDYFDSGRWYSVTGEDGLCFAASVAGGIATKTAVYGGGVGGICEDLTCITQTNSSYGSYSSEVAWRSKTGELYHVFVAGGQENVGEFEVYFEASECASNSNCNDAKLIDGLNLPFIDIVEPDLLSVDDSTSNVGCLGQISWSKFYYELEGTGECLSASLTALGESKLSLETGDCNSPTCIDQLTRQDEIITWVALEGTTYKLAVASSERDFTLVISVSSQCVTSPHEVDPTRNRDE